jgi:hypothetical protein
VDVRRLVLARRRVHIDLKTSRVERFDHERSYNPSVGFASVHNERLHLTARSAGRR